MDFPVASIMTIFILHQIVLYISQNSICAVDTNFVGRNYPFDTSKK